MKTIINIFKDIQRYYQNRRNGVYMISEREFKNRVDKTKPIIIINN